MERRIDYINVAPGIRARDARPGKISCPKRPRTGTDESRESAGLPDQWLRLLHRYMHWKDLRVEGENEQRSTASTPGPSPRITPIASGPRWRGPRRSRAWPTGTSRTRCSEEACRYFTEAELVNLTLCVVAINGWRPSGHRVPVAGPGPTSQPNGPGHRLRPCGPRIESSAPWTGPRPRYGCSRDSIRRSGTSHRRTTAT